MESSLYLDLDLFALLLDILDLLLNPLPISQISQGHPNQQHVHPHIFADVFKARIYRHYSFSLVLL